MRFIFLCYLKDIWLFSTHSDDQDNVAELLRRLDPSNRWSFRKSADTEEKLMLVHQTRDQQQLLYKYGNEICLLDATHKTTRYGLPLFFIVVKANVNYQIIASFVVLEETEEAIKEAIAVVKSWNQSWQPKSWMVDCCAAEISAVSTIFPGNHITDFVIPYCIDLMITCYWKFKR